MVSSEGPTDVVGDDRCHAWHMITDTITNMDKSAGFPSQIPAALPPFSLSFVWMSPDIEELLVA